MLKHDLMRLRRARECNYRAIHRKHIDLAVSCVVKNVVWTQLLNYVCILHEHFQVVVVPHQELSHLLVVLAKTVKKDLHLGFALCTGENHNT